MFDTMWRKAWRDLWLRKMRTIFVIAAIAASTFALGTVLVTYHLLDRDMNASFLRAKPHHLSLSMDQADENLLSALREWCELAEATGIEALQEFARQLRSYTLQPA